MLIAFVSKWIKLLEILILADLFTVIMAWFVRVWTLIIIAYTWGGRKVMSFVHLLALTIAQDRADKVKENSLSSRSNKRIARSGSRRTLITVLYCGCFFSFGTTMAILGPTLMELGHRVHHGLDMMSWLFFTQASYALLGASIAGILLDR